MFPTLSNITEYLFGFTFPFPVQTFGLFVALAFVLAYQVFSYEFVRKEQLGWIHPFTVKTTKTKYTLVFESFLAGVLGFSLGFKITACIENYGYFVHNPLGFIFSSTGDVSAGTIIALLFIYVSYKRNLLLQSHKLVKETVHPYQLMPSLVIGAALWGFLGAKLFNCIDNYDDFTLHPLTSLFSSTGWTFYGGLIVGGLAFLVIGNRHGIKLIHLVDIGSPGMLVAYGVGRIGCHLSGDGDWGIVNHISKPPIMSALPDWLWSFRYPHNSLKAGELIRGCVGNHCRVLQEGVYPTSLYESMLILTAFFLVWKLRWDIKVPGVMFGIYLIVTGTERFLIEFIKVNKRFTFLGLNTSQAQLIAACFILSGICWLTVIQVKRNASTPLNCYTKDSNFKGYRPNKE
jgi:phosphatidylglycerol:prolipoprotein diacylglycerol transferase